LDAALKLFLERGYASTKVDDIAAEANVSTATLYKHFSSKPKMFGAIMEQVWDNTDGKSSINLEGLAPKTALLKVGTAYADLLIHPHMQPLFRVIIAEVNHFPELGEELYERGKKPFLDVLHHYLEEQVMEKHLNIENIALATRQFLGMINDVLFWPRLLLPNLQISEAEAQDVVIEATYTFLSRYSEKPIKND
jgi:TetR/AcrR family transcriptional regulator, regulator of autoinduction and epiphytic fitness